MVLTSGCVLTNRKQIPTPAAQEVHEPCTANEQQKKQIEQTKQVIAALQMKLLEKHAEVDRVTTMNDRLVSELIRHKAQMQNRRDRAETVRIIAEVDTILGSKKQDKVSGSHANDLIRAEKYLADSKGELEKANIEGAYYLASQALEQLQETPLPKVSNGRNNENTLVNFAVPLQMKLLVASNIRIGPSLDEKIQFVLEAGRTVAAIGYQDQWVKVNIKGQGNGWIYYSLLY